MGTRGAVGVTKNGKDYAAYNHFDSYPSGLGVDILRDIEKIVSLKDKADTLKIINEQIDPTAEDIEALAPYTNLSVGGQSTSDWYCLTRGLQGSLVGYLKAGYIPDSVGFLEDSLFCEWAYIINFDTNKLEVYEGFQKSPPKGRFAKLCKNPKPSFEGGSIYYPVGLVAEFDLDNLPTEEKFLEILEPSENE